MKTTENPIEAKSFQFAARAVRLYRYLTQTKKEYVISNQFVRSGMSIGANVAEALRGQTRPDFTAKMSIALKEANETDYWIRLLYETEYLTQPEFDSLSKDINELISILVSICKTAQQNQNQNKKQNAKAKNTD